MEVRVIREQASRVLALMKGDVRRAFSSAFNYEAFSYPRKKNA